MLKKITLLREPVANCDDYPPCIPVIRNLDELTFKPRVCFFAGDNGTGKSTRLEAIAAHYGFGREGAIEISSMTARRVTTLWISWYGRFVCPSTGEPELGSLKG